MSTHDAICVHCGSPYLCVCCLEHVCPGCRTQGHRGGMLDPCPLCDPEAHARQVAAGERLKAIPPVEIETSD